MTPVPECRVAEDFLRQYQLDRPEPIQMERPLFNTVT